MFKKFFLAQFFLLLLLKSVSAAKVEEINISGNERISKDTIIIFDEYLDYKCRMTFLSRGGWIRCWGTVSWRLEP